jgi:hypothetical protein
MAARSCKTHALKQAAVFAKSTLAAVGTVHVVAVTFKNTGGADAGVDPLDVDTALTYLTLAAPQVSAYCSQYGVPAISVDATLLPFVADLGGSSTYTDAQLQGWVNQIVQEQGFGPDDALVFFNPPSGVENSDAPVSLGVLGYHGAAPNPYSFINVLGSGFTVDDQADVYAVALSHEIAEMTVDPAADNSKPEVCDPCAGNCNVDYRNYFDANSNWIQGSPAPTAGYAFFVEGIATPATVGSCPAPYSGCIYSPQGAPPTPPGPQPTPCIAILQQAVMDLEAGNLTKALEGLISGIECLITQGFLSRKDILKRLIEKL